LEEVFPLIYMFYRQPRWFYRKCSQSRSSNKWNFCRTKTFPISEIQPHGGYWRTGEVCERWPNI